MKNIVRIYPCHAEIASRRITFPLLPAVAFAILLAVPLSWAAEQDVAYFENNSRTDMDPPAEEKQDQGPSPAALAREISEILKKANPEVLQGLLLDEVGDAVDKKKAPEAAPKSAPKWKKDVTKTKIPKAPAWGMVRGKEFKMDKATISDAGILSIRSGKEFFADMEFLIFTFVHDKKDLAGKKFKIGPGQAKGVLPHIHLKYKVPGKNIPKTEMFMNKYSMVLEFGKEGKDGLQGKIFLTLPDEGKSFVAGTFTAKRK